MRKRKRRPHGTNLLRRKKELNKAVRIYPQFASAWTLLGEIHRQHNQLTWPRTEYAQPSSRPQFVNPTYGLAMIAMQEKKWGEAIRLSDQSPN